MYGLVNKALEDFIISAHGEAACDAIKAKAGVDLEAFVASTDAYPDEVTYKLVEAASHVLALPVSQILVPFGEHWVLGTGLEHYGALLRSGGSTVREFLLNMPHLHTRLKLLYPKLQPPAFACTDVDDFSLLLHYYTHRHGLADFVIGALLGLGRLYETPVTTALVQSKAQGADHDVFHVAWGDAGA